MDWSDSVFREHPKYFGGIEFKDSSIIGDNGITSSKKYLAFRNNTTEIGILSTDFSTNISEKLASGRRAEYGAKVYTTSNINTLNTPNNGIINVLQFNPYSNNQLYCGDSNGTLTIYDINENKNNNISKISESIYSISSHICCNDILCIGGKGNISIVNLTKNESVINTQIMDGNDILLDYVIIKMEIIYNVLLKINIYLHLIQDVIMKLIILYNCDMHQIILLI